MQQTMITALLVALMATLAGADDLYKQLQDDHSRDFRKGEGYLEDYFDAQDDLEGTDGRRAARYQKRSDEAAREFMLWLRKSGETLGVDLRTKPAIVLKMIDEARKDHLNKRGFRKGRISFFREENPQGMSRLEYALLVPDVYDIRRFEVQVPAIIALHGRATDPKHPAFRSADSNERGRQVIYNYWRKTPAAEKALILAPTGKPGGFKFHGRNIYEDRQVFFRSLIEVMRNYRVDGNRLYLDAQGDAIRFMCRQTFFFAGFVLRDHIMNRRDPLLPKERWFLLKNLNGKPLVYLADERYWKDVGEPTWKALQEAYKDHNPDASLKLIKAKRDPGTGALQADAGEIWNFLSGRTRSEPKEFTWRFPNENYNASGPVELLQPNFNLDYNAKIAKVPLEKKCGRLHYKATVVEETKLENGKPVMEAGKPVKISVNRIEIAITECEKIALMLHDGIVDLNLPLTVVVNGKTLVEQQVIERNWEYFWRNVLPARFFMTPYVHRLELTFEGIPQWDPPEEKNEAKEGETEAGDGDASGEDGAKDSAATASDAAKAGE